MKTPRLALFALLVLALAPVARATEQVMPTWPVIEEGPRSWPTVRFSIGNDHRSLQCRYKECNPATNKGQSNLFLLNKTGAFTPTTVTIYIAVRRSKLNPRYYTDGPDDMVAQTISAQTNSYTSELSHYKLDNTGGKLSVMQGTTRYPATTDIDEAQYNSYDRMMVAPPDPKKMVDDEIEPSTPAAPKTTWWCDQNSGEIIGVLPEQKAPEGYTPLASRSSTCGKKPSNPLPPTRTLSKLPTAGKWKDTITPVGEWRAVQASAWPILGMPVPVPALTFYCYHEKMDGDKDLKTYLQKNPLIVECVNWSDPTDDATKEEAGKKYKVRNNLVQFDLAYRNGSLETLSDVKGVIMTEKASLPDALGGEKFVKVTAAQTPSADGSTLALIPTVETRWLTKSQADRYASLRKDAKDDAERKALDVKYRDLVKAQIRPGTVSKYEAALKAPPAKMAGEITAAIGTEEMWGGEVKAVVASFQENADPATAKLLEIQLSKADWTLLSKRENSQYSHARIEYSRSRGQVDGSRKILPMDSLSDNRTFEKDFLDPVALRLSVEAALKAMSTAATPDTRADPVFDMVNLTENQIKLLTPGELNAYTKQLNFAKEPKVSKETKEALYKMNAEYKALIKDRKPYVQPANVADFAKLQDWQKRRFCPDPDLPVPSAGIQSDVNTDFKGTGEGGNADLNANVPKSTPATAEGKAWSKDEQDDACKKFKEQLALGSNPSTNPRGTPSVGTNVPSPVKTTSPDTENATEKKSEWLTQDLLVSAAKGAMIGLLVGSLFGPVGLVVGPMIGAALFYGLTKIMG